MCIFKKTFYSLIIIITSLAQAGELEKFLESLKQYRPNAPWITQDLLELPVEGFEIGWREVMLNLTQADKRWFYFCDKEQDFDQERYWHQCLWQCSYYDQWFDKLYVDAATGILVYKTIDKTLPANSFSVFDYARVAKMMNSAQDTFLADFYAFYFDCIAHFFCCSVDLAYKAQDVVEIYSKCWLIGRLCMERLETILIKNNESSWYPVYSLMFKRYQEVYALLEEELSRKQ
jgi:hypothetical protein